LENAGKLEGGGEEQEEEDVGEFKTVEIPAILPPFTNVSIPDDLPFQKSTQQDDGEKKEEPIAGDPEKKEGKEEKVKEEDTQNETQVKNEQGEKSEEGVKKESEVKDEETEVSSEVAKKTEVASQGDEKALKPGATCLTDKQSRRFNIDLLPKLIWSNGSIVQLLIRSGVGRYLEFKSIEHSFLYLKSNFHRVPSSKNDIFSDKLLTLKEKRLLGKFISTVMNEESQAEIIAKQGEEPFLTFLKSFNLTPNIISFILYSIALLNTKEVEKVTCMEGLGGKRWIFFFFLVVS